ncbi:MAG: rare lipoprotein [Thermoleophilaceae bacterium]|nr:rare lipoprotein [Thermoleophilaceae bacterium]
MKHARRLTLAAALCCAVLPATAHADGSSGGTAAPGPPQTTSQPGASSGSGDVPLTLPAGAYVRQHVLVHGAARRARGKPVRIERRRAGGAWTAIATVRANRRGAFDVTWQPRRWGGYELRALVGHHAAASSGGTSADAGSGGGRYLPVYERAIATWYGPGFFGRTTSCGIELQPETVGVAHRTLPCGTQVQIAYAGRTITVPVIDRGPFANNADWDLTQAAAQQLGMTGTSRIGAMPVSPER